MAHLSFRPLAESDLPQLARWVSASHVQEWWRRPIDLDHVRAKYLPRIDRQDPTEVFVIVNGLQDIGIIQRYRLSADPVWDNTIAATGLTTTSVAGIDYLIGAPEQVGKGTGTQAVQAFADLLLADYPDVEHIAVTPQEANRAS